MPSGCLSDCSYVVFWTADHLVNGRPDRKEPSALRKYKSVYSSGSRLPAIYDRRNSFRLDVDVYPRKLIIFFGTIAWSLSCIACGLATSFQWLFLARMGVGIGEATLIPAPTLF